MAGYADTHARGPQRVDSSPPGARDLVAGLGAERWSDRRAAEERLVELGPTAVPAVLEALSSGTAEARWSAARVLGEVADPAACPALVLALEDDDGGVRWLAAQALIRAGRASYLPLLQRLLGHADSHWLQEGAHHVLRGLASPVVSPVILALEGHYPMHTVPVAASEALRAIELQEEI